jgi:fused signal recognition particle receptor
MDLSTIIFGVLALAFLVLIIQAIRQMGAPLEMEPDEEEAALAAAMEAEEEPEPEEEEEPEPSEPEEMREPEPQQPTAAAPAEPEEPEEPSPRKKPRKQPDRKEEEARLRKGLAKTRGGFIARLGSLFRGKHEIDAEMLDEVEEILFTADIGVRTSQELIDSLRKELSGNKLGDPDAIWSHIRKRSDAMLSGPGFGAIEVDPRVKPFVILVIGVNGTGKTTTIGKLAARLKEEGHEVLLAAADTFRAAAVEQLEIWSERAGASIVKPSKEGADPSSVIVDALKQAKDAGVDVVIADTAGRLHTKANLMDELQKVRRSISKWVDGAPHETLLVLDATMGQNAIAQATLFKEAMDINGLILTKLDGTAKGGVVLGICNELKIPVRFIGIGEKMEDLREFEPRAFVQALYQAAEPRAD